MVRSVSRGTEVSAIMPVKCQNSEVALSGRAKLLELSSKCGRTASETADDRISAALRGMACEFSTMADSMDREVAA